MNTLKYQDLKFLENHVGKIFKVLIFSDVNIFKFLELKKENSKLFFEIMGGINALTVKCELIDSSYIISESFKNVFKNRLNNGRKARYRN